jgi:metallophosphoesterase superfamily enzyme
MNHETVTLSKAECLTVAKMVKELVLVHGHKKTKDEKAVINKVFDCAYPPKKRKGK